MMRVAMPFVQVKNWAIANARADEWPIDLARPLCGAFPYTTIEDFSDKA
jgi:hypothetical protein